MDTKRKGAKDRKSIPPEVLAGLNRGEIETATLSEGLAVDFAVLMASVVPEIGEKALRTMRDGQSLGVTRRMALAADLLLDSFGESAGTTLAAHPSDTVRGWACFVIGRHSGFSLEEKLRRIRPLADDRHFGVREWAWLAVRPAIADEIQTAIGLLSGWTADASAFVRRFASEATRPRGVWCAHIGELKQNPALGLPILEPLRADPEKYVQDSVGNWLNDAAKSEPGWVKALCENWKGENPATSRIIGKALRSL